MYIYNSGCVFGNDIRRPVHPDTLPLPYLSIDVAPCRYAMLDDCVLTRLLTRFHEKYHALSRLSVLAVRSYWQNMAGSQRSPRRRAPAASRLLRMSRFSPTARGSAHTVGTHLGVVNESFRGKEKFLENNIMKVEVGCGRLAACLWLRLHTQIDTPTYVDPLGMASSQDTLTLVVKQLQHHANQIAELTEATSDAALLQSIVTQQAALEARMAASKKRLASIGASLAKLVAAVTTVSDNRPLQSASPSLGSSSGFHGVAPNRSVAISSATLSTLAMGGGSSAAREFPSQRDYNDDDDDDDDGDDNDLGSDDEEEIASRPAAPASRDTLSVSQAAAAAWVAAIAAAQAVLEYRRSSTLSRGKLQIVTAKIDLKDMERTAAKGHTSLQLAKHRRTEAAQARAYSTTAYNYFKDNQAHPRYPFVVAWYKATLAERSAATAWVKAAQLAEGAPSSRKKRRLQR